MIRKLLLFIILTFVTFWFAGAYLIKYRVTSIIKQLDTDNIKITYDKLAISGFPKMWKIEIIAPQIRLIDHTSVHDLHIPKLLCLLDFSFKKMKLLLEPVFHYQQLVKDQIKEYKIHAADTNIIISLKLDQPLYQLSDQAQLATIIKSFELNNTSLTVSNNHQDIFDINDLGIFVAASLLADSEDILLRMKAVYKSKNETLNLNSAVIDFDALFKFVKNTDNTTLYNKGFTINNLHIGLEKAKVNLHGTMNLSKGTLPQGRFFVNLNNYNEVVDKLVPDNFIISRPIFKKLITRAVSIDSNLNNSSNIVIPNDAQFDIVFSEKGINIGSINLLDLKVDN
ncbi:hypothetical protein [Candidatus Trichorickettsia mobilis]|uniref:hypothetical protein n=1 Tax=Candidatus Trichorickettsia mobilis TaxID=1346319 RepID=UPI00292F0FBD|nr:hypothetical protein [Candidatus Trichorickettsia mobilis]